MARSQTACWQLEAQGSLGQRLVTATRRAWICYWTHRAARATAGVLHKLDDRTLKDIGIDRSEVESVAFAGCGRQSRSPERRVRTDR